MSLMTESHQSFGQYDFLAMQIDDTFCVPTLGSLDSKDFGNFMAGFAAGYLGSEAAYAGVRAGGDFYGFKDDRAPGGPPRGPGGPEWKYLGDDAVSVWRINQGYSFGKAWARAEGAVQRPSL
jgi:hypothetical protein